MTGGAVRLTGSGLGCPTWPRCTDASFVPHGELGVHGVIEFGNRMLTFVLAAVAIACWVAARWSAWRSRPLRPAAVLALDGHRARRTRAGGDRRPHRAHRPQPVDRLVPPAGVDGDDRGLRAAARRAARPRPRGGAAAGCARWRGWCSPSAGPVLYVGTVVTGSGPHAGDIDSPRNGLDPLQVSQLHADVVFLFVGLTVGLVVAAPPARPPGGGGAAGAAAGAGADRLRAVRDRPADRAGRLPPARRGADLGRDDVGAAARRPVALARVG